MELKERIAKAIALNKGLCQWETWEEVHPEHKTCFLLLAEEILNIVTLAKDQTRVKIMDIEAVLKIYRDWEKKAALSWLGREELEGDFARQICQLYEPKHLGRAKFKSAYTDELAEPKPDEKRGALVSMVSQFGYRGTKDGKVIISTGGLSALEEAFEALCWDDPHYMPDGAAKRAGNEG